MKTVSSMKEICSEIEEYEHICILIHTEDDYTAFNKMLIESDNVKVGNKDACEADFKAGTYMRDFENKKFQYLGLDYLVVFAMDEYDDKNFTFYFGSERMAEFDTSVIFSPNQFYVDLL